MPVTQEHHISYKPEVTVIIFKGEHWILTQLARRTKNVSSGFLAAVKVWVALNEGNAKELRK